MRRKCLIIGFLLGLLGVSKPIYGQDLVILGDPIDLGVSVDGRSSPTFVDWDNDGKRDLLVGQKLHGKIRLYMNQGTDSEPVFDPEQWDYLWRGGLHIVTPAGC